MVPPGGHKDLRLAIANTWHGSLMTSFDASRNACENYLEKVRLAEEEGKEAEMQEAEQNYKGYVARIELMNKTNAPFKLAGRLFSSEQDKERLLELCT